MTGRPCARAARRGRPRSRRAAMLRIRSIAAAALPAPSSRPAPREIAAFLTSWMLACGAGVDAAEALPHARRPPRRCATGCAPSAPATLGHGLRSRSRDRDDRPRCARCALGSAPSTSRASTWPPSPRRLVLSLRPHDRRHRSSALCRPIAAWIERERALGALADELHATAALSDATYAAWRRVLPWPRSSRSRGRWPAGTACSRASLRGGGRRARGTGRLSYT